MTFTDRQPLPGIVAAMLPINHRSIFRSRWIALVWAAGIVWSAIEFVGTQPGDDGANDAAPSNVAR